MSPYFKLTISAVIALILLWWGLNEFDSLPGYIISFAVPVIAGGFIVGLSYAVVHIYNYILTKKRDMRK